MDEKLLFYLLIYAIVMGFIHFVSNVIALEDKTFLGIIKEFIFAALFGVVLLVANVVIIELISMGMEEYGIQVANDLYYLAVPALCALILFLLK